MSYGNFWPPDFSLGNSLFSYLKCIQESYFDPNEPDGRANIIRAVTILSLGVINLMIFYPLCTRRSNGQNQEQIGPLKKIREVRVLPQRIKQPRKYSELKTQSNIPDTFIEKKPDAKKDGNLVDGIIDQLIKKNLLPKEINKSKINFNWIDDKTVFITGRLRSQVDSARLESFCDALKINFGEENVVIVREAGTIKINNINKNTMTLITPGATSQQHK